MAFNLFAESFLYNMDTSMAPSKHFFDMHLVVVYLELTHIILCIYHEVVEI